MGSNLGKSQEIMVNALRDLEKSSRWKTLKKSSFYRTAPWGKTDQPDFLNAVIETEWDGTPESLLRFLQQTENRHGRTREIHWGPRTLDLDLIYGENEERNTKFLTLPHLFFWDRPFVLVPLEEVEPEFIFKEQKIHDRIMEIQGYEEVKKEPASWEGGW